MSTLNSNPESDSINDSEDGSLPVSPPVSSRSPSLDNVKKETLESAFQYIIKAHPQIIKGMLDRNPHLLDEFKPPSWFQSIFKLSSKKNRDEMTLANFEKDINILLTKDRELKEVREQLEKISPENQVLSSEETLQSQESSDDKVNKLKERLKNLEIDRENIAKKIQNFTHDYTKNMKSILKEAEKEEVRQRNKWIQEENQKKLVDNLNAQIEELKMKLQEAEEDWEEAESELDDWKERCMNCSSLSPEGSPFPNGSPSPMGSPHYPSIYFMNGNAGKTGYNRDYEEGYDDEY